MLSKLSAQKRAIIFAAFTILFWSTVATAFKLSLAHIGFIPLVFYAACASLMVLVLLCFLTGQINELKNWQRSDFTLSLFLGGLNPALYYLILFKAYDLLPAQEAQVLNFTWPIVLTLLGAIFLKQRLNWASVFAILLSFFGVLIIATRGDLSAMAFSNKTGLMLALLSTLVWSVYWLTNQMLAKQKEAQTPLLRLMMNFAFGVGWMVLIMSFSNQWQAPNLNALIGAAYIGVFEMSLAFYCWFQALRLAKNISTINNLIFLTPFASIMVIHWVLKEAIYPSTLVGLLLICASILFQRWHVKRQEIKAL